MIIFRLKSIHHFEKLPKGTHHEPMSPPNSRQGSPVINQPLFRFLFGFKEKSIESRSISIEILTNLSILVFRFLFGLKGKSIESRLVSNEILSNLLISFRFKRIDIDSKLISYDFNLGGRLFGGRTLAEPSSYVPTFWGALINMNLTLLLVDSS